MKRAIISGAILIMLSLSIYGKDQVKRDSNWLLSGVAGLNLSQISLSNWSAGGENAVGFDVHFAYSADYKRSRHLWQNRIELAYGLNQTESDGTKKRMTRFIFLPLTVMS